MKKTEPPYYRGPHLGLCPKCGEQGPLIFDVDQFYKDVKGTSPKWPFIVALIGSPRYARVMCKCLEKTC